MSRVILGWQLTERPDDRHMAAIVAGVTARYQPFFKDPIRHTGLRHENQGLLHFDVGQGEAPGLHLEDDRMICLNGSPSLTGDAASGRPRRLGPKELYDDLHAAPNGPDPQRLHRINPPFTLCWFDKKRRALGLAHDGLGADQFFIAQTAKGMAFSNKCWPILQLLGEAPRIDFAAWRYWFGLGWFPGNSTPFENVRHLDQGELILAESGSVRSRSEDTLASWIVPQEQEFSTALMAGALESFQQLIRVNQPADAKYGSDLTGGIDSRAICSFLIGEAIPCTFYTGGPALSSDVLFAGRVARRFHLDWVHVEDPTSRRDEDLPAKVDAQFVKLLLWGEGLVEPTRFQHFQAAPRATESDRYLSGGSAGVSKGAFYDGPPGRPGKSALAYRKALARFQSTATALLCDADGLELSRLLQHQVDRGAAYGLRELALLDLVYVSERVRRWQSAHDAINLFDRSVMPFVTIDHIKLAFAMSPHDKFEHRFQRSIIARHAPELLSLPLTGKSRFALDRLLQLKARLLRAPSWSRYLRRDGRSRIDHILASDSPLWRILDRGKSAARWSRFLRGTNHDLHFPLGLMAFQQWHAMYCESTPGSG